MRRYPGVIGMVLEGKPDGPIARPASALPVHHPPPAAPRLPLLVLTTPIWFLARPQLLTRAVPLAVGRDIRMVSQ